MPGAAGDRRGPARGLTSMKRPPSVTWRSMRHMDLLSAICILGLIVSVACRGDQIMCADVITVAEPLVQIRSVTSSQAGVPVDQFTLSNFSRNGYHEDAALLIAGVPKTNATVVNGTLVCSGACGFGQSEGTYAFTVSAAGAQDKVVAVAAKYDARDQGCPVQLSGGTAVTIAL
jgi:hypothetical protein